MGNVVNGLLLVIMGLIIAVIVTPIYVLTGYYNYILFNLNNYSFYRNIKKSLTNR